MLIVSLPSRSHITNCTSWSAMASSSESMLRSPLLSASMSVMVYSVPASVRRKAEPAVHACCQYGILALTVITTDYPVVIVAITTTTKCASMLSLWNPRACIGCHTYYSGVIEAITTTTNNHTLTANVPLCVRPLACGFPVMGHRSLDCFSS